MQPSTDVDGTSSTSSIGSTYWTALNRMHQHQQQLPTEFSAAADLNTPNWQLTVSASLSPLLFSLLNQQRRHHRIGVCKHTHIILSSLPISAHLISSTSVYTHCFVRPVISLSAELQLCATVHRRRRQHLSNWWRHRVQWMTTVNRQHRNCTRSPLLLLTHHWQIIPEVYTSSSGDPMGGGACQQRWVHWVAANWCRPAAAPAIPPRL